MSNSKIWDFWANYYEKLWVQKVSLGPTRFKVINELKKIIVDKSKIYRILDAGCGTGQLIRDISSEFGEYNLQLKGVDFSKEMIKASVINTETIQNGYNSNCTMEFEHMNVNDLDKSGEIFDVIICTHSFPYYKYQKQTIQAMSRIIEADGAVILGQASANTMYDKIIMNLVKATTGFAKYPSVKEIKDMIIDNFRIIRHIKIKSRFYMPSIYLFVMKQVK